ncbi:hypothetical protein LINGRAHAP2_LOCUS35464 [Linum grandiflorum]
MLYYVCKEKRQREFIYERVDISSYPVVGFHYCLSGLLGLHGLPVCTVD